MLSLGYIFKANGDIEIGEDFFTDCNKSLFAENVKMKWIFMIKVPRSPRSAIFVEVYGRSLKTVIKVKLFCFFFSVMTNHSVKLKKKHRLCLVVMNGK
jgi:hypothetical protein